MNENEAKNKQSYQLGIVSLNYNISTSFPKHIFFLKDFEKFTKIQIDSLRKKNEKDKIDIVPLSLSEKKNYFLSDIILLHKKRRRYPVFSTDIDSIEDGEEVKPSSKAEMLKLFFSLKQEKIKSIKTHEIDLMEEAEIYNIINQFQIKKVSSLSEQNFNIKKNKIIQQFVRYYKKHIKHPVTIQRFIDKLAEHTNEDAELLKVILII